MALGKVLSLGARTDTTGCLARAVRLKGTAGCSFKLTVAPRNQRVDVGSPSSGLGPVSQDSLCRQNSLLGTREHIASFYKGPNYKRTPAPSGAQAYK